MSEELSNVEMAYVLVSYGNIERMKAIGKKGETIDDIMTMLLDFYEDLRRQDWLKTESNENRYKEQIIG